MHPRTLPQNPNAPRERTPEEARRAAIWKGLGITAGAGGMLWLAKKSMAMRNTSNYRPGTAANAGTFTESTTKRTARLGAEQKDIDAYRARVRVDRSLSGVATAQDENVIKEIDKRLANLPAEHPQRRDLLDLRDKTTSRIDRRKPKTPPEKRFSVTPLQVIRFRRNVARAAIYFNLRAEDGTYLPSLDPRTLYNKGRRMVTSVNRAGEVAEDTGDIVAGRPKQPGKKRFYEKSWFRNAALGAALGGGMLYARTRAAKRGEVAPV